MSTPIDHTADILDSRDIEERIEELTAAAPHLDADERHELAALVALRDEAQPYSDDWEYGAALIADSYFTTYAEELADDIGAIDCNVSSWPLTHINWDSAAEDLKADYTSVEFDGVTYWIR